MHLENVMDGNNTMDHVSIKKKHGIIIRELDPKIKKLKKPPN